MKKLISLSIIVSVLFSLISLPVIASHWAQSSAEELIEKGIVSGYADGSLKLDNTITRAEFVKIVNKAMGFTETSDSSFLDVEQDKWYYNEFLIAKEAGYISGDNSGKANPDDNITRGEASVIIARILKLDITDTNASLMDIDLIPQWAKGSVTALFNKGLLKGYEDGTFKYDNTLTRGEAFTVIKNLISSSASNEEKTDALTGGAVGSDNFGHINASSGGGGSAGGGGGASGGMTQGYASIPVVVGYNDYTVAWKNATGAKSYKVKVELDGNAVTVDTVNTSLNLYNTFKEMAKNRNNASEDYTVSIMSEGAIGYANSAYSKPVKVNVTFECVKTPEISFRFGKENKKDRAIVEWTAVVGSSGYDVEIRNVNKTTGNSTLVSSSNYEFIEGERKVIIPDASFVGDNTYIYVIAKSADPLTFKNSVPAEYKLEIDYSDSVERDGLTKETAWVITSGDEFEQIGAQNSKYSLNHYYEIQNDITVTKSIGSSSAPFKGHIFGKKYGTSYKPEITLNIEGAGAANSSGQMFIGMIAYMEGGSISNLITKGIVKRTANIGSAVNSGMGAVAGYVKGDALITDCINYASVSHDPADGSSVTGYGMAGGIVGQVALGSIINCINYASVTSANYTGGIAGRLNGANSRVQNCANYGDVTGKDYTGGIVGVFEKTTASNNFIRNANYGKIKGSARTAGLVGHSHHEITITVKECFNAGDVESGSKASGAMIGTIGKNAVIINSFILKGPNKTNCITSYQDGKEYSVEVINVYSLIPLVAALPNTDKATPGTVVVDCDSFYYTGAGISDSGISGNLGILVDKETLKDLLEEDNSFDSSVWTKVSDFEYPQLVNNPYEKTVEKIPAVTDFKTQVLDGKIKYSWTLPSDVKALKIKVVNNTEIKPLTGNASNLWTIELPNTATEYIVDDYISGCYYEIFLTMEFSDKETVIETREEFISGSGETSGGGSSGGDSDEGNNPGNDDEDEPSGGNTPEDVSGPNINGEITGNEKLSGIENWLKSESYDEKSSEHISDFELNFFNK